MLHYLLYFVFFEWVYTFCLRYRSKQPPEGTRLRKLFDRAKAKTGRTACLALDGKRKF